MYANLALMMGAQGILAWTFNSHQGGEEQALFGLVNHDGTPSWKVDEFARIATEFKQLAKYGFPRLTHPEVAIAYSSQWSFQYNAAILQTFVYGTGARRL
jgi:beta-galactosidase